MKILQKIRKALFYVLMLMIPIIFFTVLEISLRVIGFGNDYPLVKKEQIFGKERYILNSEVARRYFNLPPDKTPQPQPEYFDINKPAKTLRLFALGGSTTAGFPFEMNVPFPFQLQYRLRNALFENWAEVINVGMAAVNSFTVLDLMPEVLALQPDGIIIYMGHNEFYGALGAGSTQNVGNNRAFIKWYLQLRRYRTFQLLTKIFAIFSYKNNNLQQAKSMMSAMAGENLIPYGSEVFNTACENFEANLQEIAKLAKAHNVPLILCTLVANLKDQPPFVSAFVDNVPEQQRQRGGKYLDQAESLIRQGRWAEAEPFLQEVLAIDSTYAAAHYWCGKWLLQQNDTAGAYVAFQKAKDYDQLRFRAPEKFNEIIARIARIYDLPLVDMQTVFRKASADAIPGKELFLEHLHPNYDGYRLMAQTLLNALKTMQILNPPKPIGWEPALPVPSAIEDIVATYKKADGGVTDLDIEFGLLRNFWLVHQWPFPPKTITLDDYRPYGNEKTKALAVQRYRDGLPWEKAHQAMADYYLARKEYDKAKAEYRAIRLRFVEDIRPVIWLGDVSLLAKDPKDARFWYQKARNMDPSNRVVAARLGRTLVELKLFAAARPELQFALAGSTQQSFTVAQRAEMYYLLGACQANLHDFEAAEAALREALKLQKNYTAAQKLLEQISMFRKKQS
jgi:tetratricopeptide (TPR) repeat protein